MVVNRDGAIVVGGGDGGLIVGPGGPTFVGDGLGGAGGPDVPGGGAGAWIIVSLKKSALLFSLLNLDFSRP